MTMMSIPGKVMMQSPGAEMQNIGLPDTLLPERGQGQQGVLWNVCRYQAAGMIPRLPKVDLRLLAIEFAFSEDRVLDRLVAKPGLRLVRRPIRLRYVLVTHTVVDPAEHSRVSLAVEFERYVKTLHHLHLLRASAVSFQRVYGGMELELPVGTAGNYFVWADLVQVARPGREASDGYAKPKLASGISNRFVISADHASLASRSAKTPRFCFRLLRHWVVLLIACARVGCIMWQNAASRECGIARLRR
jgi:hypothetical protein